MQESSSRAGTIIASADSYADPQFRSPSVARIAGRISGSKIRRDPRQGIKLPTSDAGQPVPDRQLIVVAPSHPLRLQTEECIRTVYEQAFGARCLAFPRTLIAFVDGDHRPLCAAGLRTSNDDFFSEIYLDAPIEKILSLTTRTSVSRESIFEFTTLASANAEVSPLFLRQLATLGKSMGFQWCFFTATVRLRKLLRGLGVSIVDLGPANPERLKDAACWGSYYTHQPRICAVNDRSLDGTSSSAKGVS